MSLQQLAASGLLITNVTLGLFFLPAAAAKLRHINSFVAGVRDYEILPDRAVGPVALAIPAVEFGLGCALLIGLAPTVTGVLASILMASFLAAVAINIRRGRHINCSCYGVAATTRIGAGTVARNGALLALALVVAGLGAVAVGRTYPGSHLPPAGWPAALSATDAVLLLLLITACVLLVYLLEWSVDTRSQARSAIRSLKEAS